MLKKVDFGNLKSDVKYKMSIFTITNAIDTPIDNLRTAFIKHKLDIQKRYIPNRMTFQRFSHACITCECKGYVEEREHTTNSKE